MKSYRFILICFCISIFTGCSTYFRVLKDTPAPLFKNYDSIFVGWIDLDESRWKKYGYESLKDWQEAIKNANALCMPQYFKEYMPNKKITMAASINDVNPRGSDLYIKFSNVNYIASEDSGAKGSVNVYIGSGGSGTGTSIYVNEKDVLAVTIDFIDMKEKKSLYTVSVLINATSGSGYYGWAFEGRINNSFYNTVDFIYKNLKGKIK
jgi:hypothetical protein